MIIPSNFLLRSTPVRLPTRTKAVDRSIQNDVRELHAVTDRVPHMQLQQEQTDIDHVAEFTIFQHSDNSISMNYPNKTPSNSSQPQITMTKDQLPFADLLLTKLNPSSLAIAASIVRLYAISTQDPESIRLVRLLRSADTAEQQQSAVSQLRSWVYNLLN